MLQGYYYAEKYTGPIGNLNKTCVDSDFTSNGWTCYSIGVRLDDKTYQPLPTPAYSVDIVFAADSGSQLTVCDDIDQAYIQQVNKVSNCSVFVDLNVYIF